MAKQSKKELEEYKKSKRLLMGCIYCVLAFFLLYVLTEMVAVPACFPVTLPFLSTAAILGAEEV